MTPFEIVGAITLAVVILTSLLIKGYTRSKLRDMDGVGGPSVAMKKDADHIVYMDQRP